MEYETLSVLAVSTKVPKQSYTYAPDVRFFVAPNATPTPCSRMEQERDRYKPYLLAPAVATSI
ncbi:hypothetical protein [Prevotella corporis]|uniref:hypothetical protein n=1 Tax=Prevotella corporis TaxID=28128 RepID=UPI0023F7941F|nr:hypothetical protein [Prevotella corporis]